MKQFFHGEKEIVKKFNDIDIDGCNTCEGCVGYESLIVCDELPNCITEAPMGTMIIWVYKEK